MDEADSFGFERARAKLGDEFRASRGREYDRDACTVLSVSVSGVKEIAKRPAARASRRTASGIGALTAGATSAIRRIRDNNVEASGRGASDFTFAQVTTDCAQIRYSIEGRVARDEPRHLRLKFQSDNFTYARQSGDHYRDDAASCAQLQYSITRAGSHETSEQNRIDRKSIPVSRLEEAQTSA
jgi:hypothetical protein